MPIYDKRYIKAKVNEFDGKIKTNFLGDGVHYRICKRKYAVYLHCLHNY